MSQKTILLALKEASRKIQTLTHGRPCELFRIEDVPPELGKDGKTIKRRRAPQAWVTTQQTEHYNAVAIIQTLNEVMLLIQHLEVPEEPRR